MVEVKSYAKCSRSSNVLAHNLVRDAATRGSFVFFVKFSLQRMEIVERDESFPLWFSSISEDCGVVPNFN